MRKHSTVDFIYDVLEVQNNDSRNRLLECVRNGINQYSDYLRNYEKSITTKNKKNNDKLCQLMAQRMSNMRDIYRELLLYAAIAGVKCIYDEDDFVKFFKMAIAEMASLGEKIKEVEERAEANGIDFIFAKHADESNDVLKSAKESYEHVCKLIKKNYLPKNYFNGAVYTNKLTGDDTVYVRQNFGSIKREEAKVSFVAMFDVKTLTGYQTVSAPMTRVLRTGKYYILEDDYKKVAEVGTPVMKVCFSKPKVNTNTVFKVKEASELRTVFKYKIANSTPTRRNCLLAAKKAGWQYSDFASYYNLQIINRGKNPRNKNENALANLKADFEFIKRVTFGGEEKRVNEVDFVDNARLMAGNINA